MSDLDRSAGARPGDHRAGLRTRNGAATDVGCSAETTRWPALLGEIAVVAVAGEFDLANYRVVEESLAATLATPLRELVVDLSAVTFCALRGFSVLDETAERAAAHGIGYAISGLSAHLDRVASILWEPGRPVRYSTAAAAVTAVRAAQAQRD